MDRRLLIIGPAVALSLAAACVAPGPTPEPPAPGTVMVGVEFQGDPVGGAAVSCNLGAQAGVTSDEGTFVFPWPLDALCELQVDAEGFQAFHEVVSFAPTGLYTVGLVRPPTGPPGRTTVEGRVFVDDDGPGNPLGASLFWSLWGEANDPVRLDDNLSFLKAHAVDYVRILAMVGTESWADRRIDPAAPGYWLAVDRFLDRLERHGLRAQVTLLADAQAEPESGWRGLPSDERDAFIDAWAGRGNARPELIQFFEVANEHWQNGVEDLQELRSLGDRLRDQTSIPVALSAPEESRVEAVYAGWTGIATMHYDRDIGRADGPWRPVRQPWGWPGEYFPSGGEPGLVVNNEPIGPDSSVAADDDPVRLALGYVTTFVAGNGAYVYHAGAGIRGGGQADLDRGRLANLYDYRPELLLGIEFWRRNLPGGMAGWTRTNSQWESPLPEFPWDGFQRADDRGDIVQAYATTRGSEVYAVLLGVRRSFTVESRWTLDQELVDPATGEILEAVSLEPGGTWTVPTWREGYVIRGTRR